MKKTFLRLGEIVCVLLLIGFIAFVSSQDKVSSTPFVTVAKAVISTCDINGLRKRNRLEFKGKFSLDVADYSGVIYYSSDSVMDVRELMIISADNKEALKNAEKKISLYVKEKGGLFEGYAPKESELIASHVLTEKKGYLLFYVGEEKEKVLSAFSESL